jgi:uncharacterized membrane protein
MSQRKPKKRNTQPPSPGSRWPSATQVLRQAGVILVIVVAWAVLFNGFLQVTGRNTGAQSGIIPGASVPPSKTTTETTVQAGTSVAAKGSADTSFARDVQPILQRRCVKCHGGEKTQEGLILATYDDLLNGSWNGPVIEPGKSTDSLLIGLITEGKMPKNEPSLLPAEIRTIAAWVDAGASNN